MAFEKLHTDMNFNFQFNRLLSYGESACKRDDVIAVSKHTYDFASWYTQWYFYAELAEKQSRYLHSMYYYRMAEFFLMDSDPKKNEMYRRMCDMFRKAFPNYKKQRIAYKGGFIPCIVIENENAKGTVLVHGGYDSFIEEFFLTCIEFSEQGFDIILYEGEGQGETLRNGFKFNHKWEEIVSCILDHFEIKSCSLIGISWGGYFALRAAAKEKRIQNVVAYDILYDGLDVQMSLMKKRAKFILSILYKTKNALILNYLVRKAMAKSFLANWAVEHGMFITGTKTPYEFYKSIEKHTLKGIENEIDQNVLLLAGELDHYIPLSHFYILKQKLKRANVTSRIFTEEEGGEQHCQVGNYPLATNEIIKWLTEVHKSN